MPSLVRNSSLGPIGNARRGPRKEHIPYRADDLETGKKTGLAVTYVDRNSDDFESFSEVMKQADGRTPAKKKRKSVPTTARVEEEDDGGEMSMDFDEQPSFSIINQDDEDEGGNEMEDEVQAAIATTPIQTSSPRRSSGKGKARIISPLVVPASDDLPQHEYEAQDNEMGGEEEDDIAQGLQDVEMGAGFDNGEDWEDEDEEVVHTKKAKAKGKGKDKPVEKKRRKDPKECIPASSHYYNAGQFTDEHIA